MLLIVTSEVPDPVNNLGNVVKALDARNIPYKIIKTCDPQIIKRKDIRGIILPGTNRRRIKPDEPQPELE